MMAPMTTPELVLLTGSEEKRKGCAMKKRTQPLRFIHPLFLSLSHMVEKMANT